jgi:hypothetical protein
MKYLTLFCTSALLASALPLAAGETDTLQVSASKVFSERKDGSVRLSITRKAGNEDKTFEITGLSLDGKGLLVTSLNAIENGSSLASMMAVMGGGDGEEAPGLKKDKGELTRVAMLRADATEAEADLVLTDDALDLALIRVRPADGGAAVVPPAPPVAKAAPVLLDPLVGIDRQGAEFQRTATTTVSEVAALITTPRSLYLTSLPFSGGTAVYNLAGEWLGLAAHVHDESVIVPAAAILKVAEGAPAKAPEKKEKP